MNVAKKVLDLVEQQFQFGNHKVTPESRFVEDLGFDSLDSVEFAMAIEDEFAIYLDDDDCEKCATVGDAIRLVEHCMESQ